MSKAQLALLFVIGVVQWIAGNGLRIAGARPGKAVPVIGVEVVHK